MLFRSFQYPALGLVILYLSIFANLGYTAHSIPRHSHGLSRRDRQLLPGWTNLYLNEFNVDAHLYEKIYLWEAYQILMCVTGLRVACSVTTEQTYFLKLTSSSHASQATETKTNEGTLAAHPSKQDLILPFNVQRGQDQKCNQHLVNGKRTGQALDYKEFMLRLEGKDADEEGTSDISEPTSVDDLERAQRQLSDTKAFGGQIEMRQVSPYFQPQNSNSNSGRAGKKKAKGSSGGAKQKAQKLQDKMHVKFLKTVGNRLHAVQADKDKKNLGSIPERHARAMEIADRMVKLRGASTEGFLILELSREPSEDRPNYWGLQRPGPDSKKTSTVMTDDEADCGVPGMDRYQSLKFLETYNANTEKIRGKNLPSGEDFQNWAKDLGNPKSTLTVGPANTESNIGHWMEEDLWRTIASGKTCTL